MASNKRRCTSFFLPAGWSREETTMMKGLSTGTNKVTYFTPDGRAVHNKAQLMRALGPKYDLTNFDYHSGKTTSHNMRKKAPLPHKLMKDGNEPMSIFRPSGLERLRKMKCKVVRNHPKSMSKNLANVNSRTSPLQVLHFKRFEPYMKKSKNNNILSNTELEHIFKSQKTKRGQEDMYMLLSQCYNHPDICRIGPLPTRHLVATVQTRNITSLKNRTSLSLLDFTENDFKLQEKKIQSIRAKLSAAQKEKKELK